MFGDLTTTERYQLTVSMISALRHTSDLAGYVCAFADAKHRAPVWMDGMHYSDFDQTAAELQDLIGDDLLSVTR